MNKFVLAVLLCFLCVPVVNATCGDTQDWAPRITETSSLTTGQLSGQ